MKIAIIGAKGIPCREGGVERHVEELAKKLVQKGHRVFVYSRKNYTKNKRKKYKGIDIIYTPSIPTKNLDTITHTFISLIHVLFKRVDVIHIHSVGPSLLSFIPRILKRKSVTITTFQCRDRFDQKWGILARFFLTLAEKTVVLLPDATIVVSKILYQYCRKNNPTKSQIYYIPNGAILARSKRAKLIKKWGLSENNYFLTVSRLVPRKGIHYLINAFQKLNTNKKLVIVGGGNLGNQAYENYLKKTAKGNSNIIFTGSQQGETLLELFSNAYLYVLPSKAEGLSLSLLEALGFGRCVLVSNIPENKEAMGEAGYSFKSRSVASIKKGLEFLNNHPELVLKMGRLARERVHKFYNWNKIANQTIKLYQALLLKKCGVETKNPKALLKSLKYHDFRHQN